MIKQMECEQRKQEDTEPESGEGVSEEEIRVRCPEISLFGDFHQLANFRHHLALTRFHIGFTKLGNDLIYCVTFLRHSESPFRAVRPIKILSLTMVTCPPRTVPVQADAEVLLQAGSK